MNPRVKTEGKCNESVNNELKIMRKRLITSNNDKEQIMEQTHRIHVSLFFYSLFWYT